MMTKEEIEKLIDDKLAAAGVGGAQTNSGPHTPNPPPPPTV